jgi:hypothetical protein
MIYSYFKDFAGPIATIVAAAVAVGVTAVFQWQQSRIVQRQTDIAFDQLRNNLFEKRCAHRRRRPRCPAHGDHVIRSMTTGAAHELDGAVGFIF